MHIIQTKHMPLMRGWRQNLERTNPQCPGRYFPEDIWRLSKGVMLHEFTSERPPKQEKIHSLGQNHSIFSTLQTVVSTMEMNTDHHNIRDRPSDRDGACDVAQWRADSAELDQQAYGGTPVPLLYNSWFVLWIEFEFVKAKVWVRFYLSGRCFWPFAPLS